MAASAVENGTPTHTHVHGIVDGLMRRGWRVRIVSARPSPLVGLRGQLSRLWDVVVKQVSAARGIRSYDALYCRCHFALWPIAFWAKLRGIPVVQEINGPFSDYFAAHPAMAWARWPVVGSFRAQMRRADALVAVTEPMRSWIESVVDAPRIVVVPNGADTDRFCPEAKLPPAEQRRIASAKDPYAVFVGSLAVWQGVETMIESTRAREWPAGVRLVIAGGGAARDQVEAAAGERIVYLGPVAHQSVPGLIAGSIAGLAPKIPVGGLAQTGFSALKLYETLACGVPVIASDAPGHRETIRENDCGILIPVGDARALALAVARIHDDPEAGRRMGARGLEYVRREASWDRRAGDVHELMVELMSARPGVLVGDAR